ncbi:MAG: FMN-binding negative transcriptional regulator [Vulcanimicrobiaceae bacterium]
MYQPSHFRESRVDVLRAAIREIRFAIVVGNADSGLLISHVPMLFDPQPEPNGRLFGHLARANDQWREGSGRPVVAIFLGPHGYISPNWYVTKAETGKVVPTWNYIAVHVHGRLQSFDDPVRLRAVVTALTDAQEAEFAVPWRVDDAPAAFIDSQLRGIVGIEIPIDRIEGKWKLSQNRPSADIDGVVAALHGIGNDESLALARAITAARTPA